MRYRDGSAPDLANPYTESMHASLMLSVVLGLFIGVILLLLGLKGKKLWLICWSVGLMLCSLGYIVLRLLGIDLGVGPV